MLEVKNASLEIDGVSLFTGLSFLVGDGQILCVRGASGTGKTSLLRALLGFWPLSGGFISYDGELLTPASVGEFRKHIAYVPQEASLPSEWVRDLVQLPFRLKANRGKAYSKDRLMVEWGRLGLEADLYDRRVSELSGGQRQRVVLSVCGLLGKPVLLVDEPTSALDRQSAELVLEYLRGMAARGCTVVVVSHDDIFAEACDKVIEL